jgi:hypothetical protein
VLLQCVANNHYSTGEKMKAFPHTYDKIVDGHVATNTNYGMDLRDWFAGLAMQGELASQDSENHWDSCNVLAHYAYSVADAMMKARNENNE